MDTHDYRMRLVEALDQPEPHWQILKAWIGNIVTPDDARAAHLVFDDMTRHIDWSDQQYFLNMAIESYLAWLAFEPFKAVDERKEKMRHQYGADAQAKVEREYALAKSRERRDHLTRLALADRAGDVLKLYERKNTVEETEIVEA